MSDENADSPAAAGAPAERRAILVTGLSGAGRSTCLKFLEDMGYEAVDNVPLPFLPLLLQGRDGTPPATAIGIDSRARGFDVSELIHLIDTLRTDGSLRLEVLYLDCEDDKLVRRFTETRRRHPLAGERPVADGIAQERELLRPLRMVADDLLDTTDTTVPEFREILRSRYGLKEPRGISISVVSFSFKRGLPREADLVFDVRFLTNPHYDDVLRPLDGRDAPVGAFIEKDAGYATFFDSLTALLLPLLPRYQAEGKSYLTVAIGCSGGRHRSVYTSERLFKWLTDRGARASLRHRDVDR